MVTNLAQHAKRLVQSINVDVALAGQLSSKQAFDYQSTFVRFKGLFEMFRCVAPVPAARSRICTWEFYQFNNHQYYLANNLDHLMGETKPEESLGALDVAVVVADDHHVILVPGQGGRNGQAGQVGQDGQGGQDGQDGQAGQDGQNGQGGQDGQAGQDGCQYNVEHFLVIAEDFGLVEKSQR